MKKLIIFLTLSIVILSYSAFATPPAAPPNPAGAGTGDLLADGTIPLTANWDMGAFSIEPQTIELGHATDTTLARSGAGAITIEGSAVTLLAGTHDTAAELDALYEAELTNSAGLLAALSDETGTGVAVFSDTPTLVAPALGAATATSLTLDASATPNWVFSDSDNSGATASDKEIAKIHANSTTITEDSEDGEIDFQVMDSGTEKTFIKADGDTTDEYVQVGPTDGTYNMHIYHSVDTIVDRWSGESVIRTVAAGQTSLFGQVLHIHTDGELTVADADVASAASAPGVFVALEAGTGAKLMLMRGFITETDWNWTPGALMYLDDDPTENEGWTAVAGIPATAGDQVQVLGIAVSADTIYFNPSLVLVEVP